MLEFDEPSWRTTVRVLDATGKCWYQEKYDGPRARYVSEWAAYIAKEYFINSERTINPTRHLINLAFLYDGPDITNFVDEIMRAARRWIEHGAAGQSVKNLDNWSYVESLKRH